LNALAVGVTIWDHDFEARASMKALEFESRLANKDQIQLPPEVAQQIPDGSAVRVILLFDSGEDEGWRQLSVKGFSAAYAEEDDVYEKLIHEPASG
jgi:hypothetical protein